MPPIVDSVIQLTFDTADFWQFVGVPVAVNTPVALAEEYDAALELNVTAVQVCANEETLAARHTANASMAARIFMNGV